MPCIHISIFSTPSTDLYIQYMIFAVQKKNNNPDEHGAEAELRKRDTHEFGSHTHFPESKEMSPEKACLAHSPVSSSSFNKGFFDNDETLHREIIRNLGVSFVEITTTEDNNASADFNSRITSTSAGVMGMKSMEP